MSFRSITSASSNRSISDVVGASYTIILHPDTTTGKITCDGYVLRAPGGAGETWDAIHDATSGGAPAANYTTILVRISTDDTNVGKYDWLSRGVIGFDLSRIPANANLVSANIQLYGSGKTDNLVIAPTLNIYAATPAANNTLVLGDYDQVGATAYSTAITYASYSTSGYNTFSLNSIGIALITTALGGVVIFGVREAKYDAADATSSFVLGKYSDFTFYSADKGVGFRPKLTITYTLPSRVIGSSPTYRAIS